MKTIKLACYRKKDWSRFIKIVDDPERIHDSWKQWNKDFQKAKQHFISLGHEVVEVELDLDELIVFCRLRNLAINGSARSQYIQEKEIED